MLSRWRGRIRNWMLACIWRWWKNEPSWGRDLLPTLVDETGRFPRTSGEFIRRAFSGASVGMKSSVRSRRRSRVFRRRDYGFPILIATSISTCSRLFFKLLGALPAGWKCLGSESCRPVAKIAGYASGTVGPAAWFESLLSVGERFARPISTA